MFGFNMKNIKSKIKLKLVRIYKFLNNSIFRQKKKKSEMSLKYRIK